MKRLILNSCIMVLVFYGKTYAIPTLVQHISGPAQEGVATNIAQYNLRLPNAGGTGNMIVVAISENCSGGPPCTTAPTPSSVTDNASTPNVYTLQVSRAGINNKIFVYFSCNIANSPKIISVKYASAQPQPHRTVVVSEYYHVATTTCVDTSVTNCSSINAGNCNTSTPSLTLTTGSMTTTINGDLIWTFGVLDDTGFASNNTNEIGKFTPQGSFGVLDANLMQYSTTNAFVEGTAGTNNYNVSTYDLTGCTGCSTEDWITATVAFKADDTKGTAPTAGAIHVDRVYHINVKISWGATTAKTQIPRGANGNLIVFISAGEPTNGKINSVSDGVNTWITPITFDNSGNVFSNLVYSSQPTSTDTVVLTWTFAGAVNGGEPIWVLIISNASINAPFDKNITCSGNDTGGSFNVTITCNNSITPVQANELLIGICATFNNAEGETAISAGPAPAASIVADSCSPIAGANCSTSVEIATSPIDENDCASIAYLTSTSTVTPTWVINNDTVGTGQWTDIHALFEQAPAAVAGRTQTLLGVGR